MVEPIYFTVGIYYAHAAQTVNKKTLQSANEIHKINTHFRFPHLLLLQKPLQLNINIG